MTFVRRTSLLFLMLSVWSVDVQESAVVNLDELLAMFNWDLNAVEITTKKVDDGLYVLFGPGGNVAVSIREQGVLVVDDMFPEVIPKAHKAIEERGGGPIVGVAELHAYTDTLEIARMRIAELIAEGKSLEEVEAAIPTADFDEQYGPVANSLGFVNRVYASLKAGC